MMRRVMRGMGAHATRDGAYCVRDIVGIGSDVGCLKYPRKSPYPM